MVLSNPTNSTIGAGTSTGEIIDDDAPQCTLTVSDSQIYSGDSVDFTIAGVNTGIADYDSLIYGDGNSEGSLSDSTSVYSHTYTSGGTFTGELTVVSDPAGETGTCNNSVYVGWCGDDAVQSGALGGSEVCDGEGQAQCSNGSWCNNCSECLQVLCVESEQDIQNASGQSIVGGYANSGDVVTLTCSGQNNDDYRLYYRINGGTQFSYGVWTSSTSIDFPITSTGTYEIRCRVRKDFPIASSIFDYCAYDSFEVFDAPDISI
jgi:hypothetical protein